MSGGGEVVQASCVAFGAAGLLIRGAPGAGKSRLALELIGLGARLVADDVVALQAQAGGVWARPAPETAGVIEARGTGLLRLPHLAAVEVRWVVALEGERGVSATASETRTPPLRQTRLCGVEVDLVCFPMSSGSGSSLGSGAPSALKLLAEGAALLDPDQPLDAQGRGESG